MLLFLATILHLNIDILPDKHISIYTSCTIDTLLVLEMATATNACIVISSSSVQDFKQAAQASKAKVSDVFSCMVTPVHRIFMYNKIL